MEPLALTGYTRLAVAIIAGITLGFFLIKSDFAWRSAVLDALLLKDSRLIKTFLLIVAAGVLAFHFMHTSGLVLLHVRPAYFWASLCGGIITGAGLSLCAAVPISAIASLAAGRVYSLWVIIGMVLAIPLVKVCADALAKVICNWEAPGAYREQVGDYFSVGNLAFWIAGLCTVAILFIHFTLGSGEEE